MGFLTLLNIAGTFLLYGEIFLYNFQVVKMKKRREISSYKLLKSLIEQERLHIVLSRDKRIELMRKIKPIELINCMECLTYKYEDLCRVKQHFEDYKGTVKKLTREYNISQAVDLEDAQDVWAEFLKELSSLNLNELYQEPDEDDELGSALLKGFGDEKTDRKKRNELSGPINDIFYKPGLLLVYGTVSPDKEYRTILGERAYSFANIISQNIKVKIPIKKDVDVTGEDIKNCHIILFGGIGSNDLIEEIYDELPIAINKDSIQLGDMEFFSEDTRLIMLSPNPLNPKKYLLTYTALGLDGVAELFGLYHGPTDFVLGNDFNWIARGFFDKTEEDFWQYGGEEIELNTPLLDLLYNKNWRKVKSKHYTFKFSVNSTAQKDIDYLMELHEKNYPLLLENTGLLSERTIEVYFYESNDEKEDICGARADGSFDPFLPRLHLVHNEPVRKFGPEKILHSLYQHINWAEIL